MQNDIKKNKKLNMAYGQAMDMSEQERKNFISK